eukprot:4350857-Ditylum_brightwellii.AAC.1
MAIPNAFRNMQMPPTNLVAGVSQLTRRALVRAAPDDRLGRCSRVWRQQLLDERGGRSSCSCIQQGDRHAAKRLRRRHALDRSM